MIKQAIKVVRTKLTDPQQPTGLLKRQHREVEAMFALLEKSRPGQKRRTLTGQLADNLAAHSAIEKEILYPACQGFLDDEKLLVAYEEHALVEHCLRRLVEADGTDRWFMPRLLVLKDIVEHHVVEEEGDFLDEVDDNIPEERSAELVDRMSARFEQAREEGHAALLEQAPESGPRRVKTAGSKRARSGATRRKPARRAAARRRPRL